MGAMDNTPIGGDTRVAALWDGLSRVMDPELDESIVDLGFVTDVSLDAAGRVDVGFRLPTYWCSPNFAFLMVDDIARELARLPFVREVHPKLHDHMASDEVNRGAHLGLSFAETFSAFEVSGTLEDLRETFHRKAFQRRQEAVILGLRRAGWSNAAIVSADLATLDRVVLEDEEAARQKPRYRELLLARALASTPSDRAFVTLEGAPLTEVTLPAHMRALRAVRINMEANGALCRGLLDARYGEAPAPEVPAHEPDHAAHACGGGGKACCGGCARQVSAFQPTAAPDL
ncbi:metal-sulfur cluster biosynthetic enzyme [Angulomicrobium tetraedrale]|uniref:Metal-sulfur cluster biosynthetic enzyme n=1 Tax=Ancylobacter tetraedralis TaxID=217068 RepID=A0A839Z2W1_9HYPH|nr:iron-sulfur cluster assembly protein [Ancylobacter tetraedralis]MBB3769959.1 metal-sulfur cluster biosynthetic enzyme [Ancylobacter tetraedralis]